MMTFLLILGAIVIGAVFGVSFLAALAKTIFDFFKGMFHIGYGCSKALIELFFLILGTLLFVLCISSCG